MNESISVSEGVRLVLYIAMAMLPIWIDFLYQEHGLHAAWPDDADSFQRLCWSSRHARQDFSAQTGQPCSG